MSYFDITSVRAIAEDMLSRADFRPLDSPPADISAAYEFQDALVSHLLQTGARQGIGGFKIAANSARLLRTFGLNEPLSGRIFSDECAISPASRPVGKFSNFAYEPEIAAVIGHRLTPAEAPFDAAQAGSAVSRFVPALELLDMRGVKINAVRLVDVIAQNITNAGAVIGGPGVSANELDAETLHTLVTIDGASELDIMSAAPQPPVEAVRWLANHLTRRGLALEAGQIVLCGTHAPIRHVSGPAVIRVEMTGLGSAELSLTGTAEIQSVRT